MPKYCPECGSLMDDYSDFCRECGARSSTHSRKYVPWSARKSIKSHDRKVFYSDNDVEGSSYSRRSPLSSDGNPRPRRGGLFKLLPTFIGLVSIILIVGLISGGFFNLDGHNPQVFANSTNNSNTQHITPNTQNNSENINNTQDNISTAQNDNPITNKTFLIVEYDGSWHGSVGTNDNMQDYDGKTSKRIEFVNIDPNDSISATIQKQDPNENVLNVKLVKKGLIIKEAETNTPYGVVTIAE